MKYNKSIIPAVIGVIMLFLTAGFAKADNNEPSTVSDLRYQIQKEIVDVFKAPVDMYYEDKNISGDAFVTITVQPNGKIIVESVLGENNILNNMLVKRIETRNLWTDTKFSGYDFTFHIELNQSTVN
ncbi:MAG TPA: hypothetical protein VN514_04235 [Ignavibacteria bacterium]|nr:hypothetical protein [Ignavibacteria bacterium]